MGYLRQQFVLASVVAGYIRDQWEPVGGRRCRHSDSLIDLRNGRRRNTRGVVAVQDLDIVARPVRDQRPAIGPDCDRDVRNLLGFLLLKGCLGSHPPASVDITGRQDHNYGDKGRHEGR